jgi:hypothetical protein
MDSRLLDLVGRLREWREARLPNCKGRIPAEIWSEAVELAHTEGIAPVSKALSLDYASLKKRMGSSTSSPAVRAAAGGTFMEILNPLADQLGECILEVRSPRGSLLRIQVNCATSTGLAALIRDFTG